MTRTLRGLVRALVHGLPTDPDAPRDSPNIWMTIRIGEYRSIEEYRAAFVRAGLGFIDGANSYKQVDLGDIFTTFAQEETEIDLVVRSVGGLGLRRGAPYELVCREAFKSGLVLCPPDVALALIFAYLSPAALYDDPLYVAIDHELYRDFPAMHGIGEGEPFKKRDRFVFMKPRG